jgi:hypothetical protein
MRPGRNNPARPLLVFSYDSCWNRSIFWIRTAPRSSSTTHTISGPAPRQGVARPGRYSLEKEPTSRKGRNRQLRSAHHFNPIIRIRCLSGTRFRRPNYLTTRTPANRTKMRKLATVLQVLSNQPLNRKNVRNTLYGRGIHLYNPVRTGPVLTSTSSLEACRSRLGGLLKFYHRAAA